MAEALLSIIFLGQKKEIEAAALPLSAARFLTLYPPPPGPDQGSLLPSAPRQQQPAAGHIYVSEQTWQQLESD